MWCRGSVRLDWHQPFPSPVLEDLILMILSLSSFSRSSFELCCAACLWDWMDRKNVGGSVRVSHVAA